MWWRKSVVFSLFSMSEKLLWPQSIKGLSIGVNQFILVSIVDLVLPLSLRILCLTTYYNRCSSIKMWNLKQKTVIF